MAPKWLQALGLLGEIAGHISDEMGNKDLLAAQIEF
jgi:hypothetical protein